MNAFLRGPVGLAMILLLVSGCVGARVGYRHHVGDPEKSGLYGGPVAQAIVGPVGLEAGYHFSSRSFGTAQGLGVVPLPGDEDGTFTPFMLVGVGADFGEHGAAIHLSGCGGALFTDAATFGNGCVRFSSEGWMGFDATGGVFLPEVMD